MDSLLTLSAGEYSTVEIVLRLAVALTFMASLLLVLSSACVARSRRFPLILSSVALGGAAWFENGVWQSWQQAFELAGNSYAVTGQLLAPQDRIIAWSLGVPTVLFCFGLALLPGSKNRGVFVQLGVTLLLLALAAPLSHIAALVLLAYAAALLLVGLSRHAPEAGFVLEARLSVGIIVAGALFTSWAFWHPLQWGGGVSGELVRGEIIHSAIDILSLVVPAILLLIVTFRLLNRSGSSE